MSTNTRLIVTIVLMFLVYSCGNTKLDVFSIKMKEHYDGSNIDKYDAVIIIPREGCGGCISEATEKASELIKNYSNILLVFTNVYDVKLLKMQFGSSLLLNKQVSVDYKNTFSTKEVGSIYPQILFLKNGKCVAFDIFSSGITSENFNNYVKKNE